VRAGFFAGGKKQATLKRLIDHAPRLRGNQQNTLPALFILINQLMSRSVQHARRYLFSALAHRCRRPLALASLLTFQWLLMSSSFAQSPGGVTKQLLDHGWTFRQAAAGETWMPAVVPGCVHTDLLHNGRIEDPYYRMNEREQQWIDKVDWEYRNRFFVDDSLLAFQHLELFFHGIDTYGDVYLNGVLILRADNMFREWAVDVKQWLKPGENELSVLLRSPIQKGVTALLELGYPLPASNDQSEVGGMGDKRVSIFTRKAGYHYGWDWGPRFVTSGLWRPVELRAWNDARITDVFIRQNSLTDEQASLTAWVTVESASAGAYRIELSVEGENMQPSWQLVELQPGQQQFAVPLFIKSPRRWWSLGLGEAHLYNLQTRLLKADYQPVDLRTTSVGLRTLRLVREPDSLGASFYVELNGVPVFMKGANYIPNDLFLPRVSRAEYERVIGLAVDANMNMLRVWGGGVYEDDYFYELCDRHGILVWQDFMFACSMYPGDDAFLENVRQEAIDNIRRLRNHPSIALWCGNNEIDVAWAEYDEKRGWGWKQQYNKTQRAAIWQAYDTLFHVLLPEVVSRHDPDRFYWPSSPMADYGELAGNNTQKGDIHYWGVWHGRERFEAFKDNIGRFMSEYGFQSFPEFRTVQAYTVPEDWDIESEVMAAHQRSGIGNLRIKEYMGWYYQIPTAFEPFLYVGQVLQAEAIRSAIEAHRRRMPLNMGSLYWQLNDCWPVASWSSTDYYRRWKALHYFVRKGFEACLISPDVTDGTLRVYGVSDLLQPLPGSLQLRLLDFGGQVLWEKSDSLQLSPNTSQVYFELPLQTLLSGHDTASVVLEAVFTSADGRVQTDNLLYFTAPKHIKLPVSNPQYTIEAVEGGYRIELSTELLAKNLYLSLREGDGFFTDNYFDLLPGRPRAIVCKTTLSRQDFEKSLQLMSLADTVGK